MKYPAFSFHNSSALEELVQSTFFYIKCQQEIAVEYIKCELFAFSQLLLQGKVAKSKAA